MKNSYTGVCERVVMFLEVFEQFDHVQLERKESNEITVSVKKFPVLIIDCTAFVKYKYKKSDLSIEDLRMALPQNVPSIS